MIKALNKMVPSFKTEITTIIIPFAVDEVAVDAVDAVDAAVAVTHNVNANIDGHMV